MGLRRCSRFAHDLTSFDSEFRPSLYPLAGAWVIVLGMGMPLLTLISGGQAFIQVVALCIPYHSPTSSGKRNSYDRRVMVHVTSPDVFRLTHVIATQSFSSHYNTNETPYLMLTMNGIHMNLTSSSSHAAKVKVTADVTATQQAAGLSSSGGFLRWRSRSELKL